MYFTMFHSTSSRCISATAFATAALFMNTAGAIADAALDVEATPASVASGIKGFEVSTETPIDGTVWFCQVVGSRSAAGSLSVKTDGSCSTVVVTPASGAAPLEVTLSGFGAVEFKRGGTVIAAIVPGPIHPEGGLPIGGNATGLNALRSDPAWKILNAALTDENLLAMIQSGAGPTSPTCASACRGQWPIPSDCNGLWDEYVCCIVEANYDFCLRYCGCDSMAEPIASIRKTGAAALFIAEELACANALIAAVP